MKIRYLTTAAVALMASSHAFAIDTGLQSPLGDVVLTARNVLTSSSPETLIWDLSNGASDLTVSDFLSGAAGSFTLSNPQVASWVNANIGEGPISFNIIAGISGIADLVDYLPDPNSGGLSTVDGIQNVISGADLSSSQNEVFNRLTNINFAGSDNNVITVGPSNAAFFNASGLFGNADINGEVGGSAINFYYSKFQFDCCNYQYGAFDQAAFDSEVTYLGSFQFLANGDLQFTSASPVPVPAAVWLFGSAMAGVFGLRRRVA